MSSRARKISLAQVGKLPPHSTRVLSGTAKDVSPVFPTSTAYRPLHLFTQIRRKIDQRVTLSFSGIRKLLFMRGAFEIRLEQEADR